MDNSTISMDELNNLSKETLIFLFAQQSESLRILTEQNAAITKQNETLSRQITDLNEKLAILIQQRFGSKTEKQLSGQCSFLVSDTGELIFNEIEAAVPDEIPEETPAEQVITYTRKKSGKRDVNLSELDSTVVVHSLTDEELAEKFPGGWHELDEEVYKEVKYFPARFLVVEHHIKVYADSKNIVRGNAPKRLLAHSILTPELAAAIIHAKFVNAMPLNRISEDYLRQDVNIPRQDMAGWMIRLNRYYLGQVHDAFKKELLKSHHLHCDETPFHMPEKGKQYMWVYHSPGDTDTHPVYLYEYPGTRGASAPDEYLKEYKGILVTDGYESYHTLARRRPDDLKVAGCWAHLKRRFAEIVKAIKKSEAVSPTQQLAVEAVKKIELIYHTDNKFKDSAYEERLNNRQKAVKPLVDAYFAWVKEKYQPGKIDSSSKLAEAFKYSLKQEPYLRVFLDDAKLPLDNNDAERSIKKFCVGKKNWQIIDSKHGAEASAMLYSLAETVKANGLKTYNYFVYLLDQLKEYPRGEVPEDVLEALMPWSDKLPEDCRKTKSR